MNFINFDISPDDKQVVFQHTVETGNRNFDYLFLYNFISGQLDTIKSDISSGVDINRQFTKWLENKIMFLNRGGIYEYDLLTKEVKKVPIPFNRKIKDFEKIGESYYFIDGNNLYSWNNTQIDTLYESHTLDYIACLRQKQMIADRKDNNHAKP